MTTTKPLEETWLIHAVDKSGGAPICAGAMYSVSNDGFTQVLQCVLCDYEVRIPALHLQARIPNPVTPLPAVDIADQLTEHINAVSDAFLQGKALLRLLEMTQSLPPWTFELRSSIKSFEDATQHLKALKDLLGIAGIEDDETLVMRAVPGEVGVR